MCRKQTSEQLWHEYSETSCPFRELSAALSALSVPLQHNQGLRRLSTGLGKHNQALLCHLSEIQHII